jgi:hypothetical protein
MGLVKSILGRRHRERRITGEIITNSVDPNYISTSFRVVSGNLRFQATNSDRVLLSDIIGFQNIGSTIEIRILPSFGAYGISVTQILCNSSTSSNIYFSSATVMRMRRDNGDEIAFSGINMVNGTFTTLTIERVSDVLYYIYQNGVYINQANYATAGVLPNFNQLGAKASVSTGFFGRLNWIYQTFPTRRLEFNESVTNDPFTFSDIYYLD